MMPGYFSDDSMMRRIHRERAIALAGPRALLMQAADPVAFAGFFEATTMLEEPYPRLQRTALVLEKIAFGTRAESDAATRPVRAIHRRVRGELPDGRAWRANDPELLLWIIATLVDSNVLVHERYVGPLSRDEKEAYWQDFRLLAKQFDLHYKDTPKDYDAFEAYMAGVLASDRLAVGPKARELAVDIVMKPPVRLAAKPLLEVVNQVTVGMLPPSIRRMYGFRWDPLRGLAVRGGAEYLRRVVRPVIPARYRRSDSRAIR